jgi:O-methyltransferase
MRTSQVSWGSSMRELLIRLADSLGVGTALRRAKAKGLAPWTPLVPEEAFSHACRQAIRRLRERGAEWALGDYLEFGVSRGTSMACMYHSLRMEGLSHVRLFGFDSFRGLPAEAAEEGWRPGAFSSTREATQRYLTRAGIDWKRVTLVQGWFKDTLTPQTRQRLRIESASFIMIDCDIYSASRDALRFAEPLIRDQAILILDDYHTHESEGQRHAFEEFLAEFPCFSIEELPTYTAGARVVLITRNRSN